MDTQISLAERVRHLEDRMEIQDLVVRYGAALDDRDLGTLGALYATEGEFHGAADSPRGRDAVVAYYEERLATYGPTIHWPNGSIVTSLNGDRATGWVAAHAEVAVGDTTVIVAMRYEDEYIREDGAWRIASRRLRAYYAAPMSELPGLLARRERILRPGLPAQAGDLPEALESWAEFRRAP